MKHQLEQNGQLEMLTNQLILSDSVKCFGSLIKTLNSYQDVHDVCWTSASVMELAIYFNFQFF